MGTDRERYREIVSRKERETERESRRERERDGTTKDVASWRKAISVAFYGL